MSDQIAVGLYRATAAAFKDGKVTLAYTKEVGQGPKVLLEKTSDCAIELGGEYSLVLQPVEETTPPIGIVPEFPEFPTPELPTLPPVTGVMPTLPGGITPPIGTLPPKPPVTGVTPELPPSGGATTLPGELPGGATTLPGEVPGGETKPNPKPEGPQVQPGPGAGDMTKPAPKPGAGDLTKPGQIQPK